MGSNPKNFTTNFRGFNFTNVSLFDNNDHPLNLINNEKTLVRLITYYKIKY